MTTSWVPNPEILTNGGGVGGHHFKDVRESLQECRSPCRGAWVTAGAPQSLQGAPNFGVHSNSHHKHVTLPNLEYDRHTASFLTPYTNLNPSPHILSSCSVVLTKYYAPYKVQVCYAPYKVQCMTGLKSVQDVVPVHTGGSARNFFTPVTMVHQLTGRSRYHYQLDFSYQCLQYFTLPFCPCESGDYFRSEFFNLLILMTFVFFWWGKVDSNAY